MNDPIEYRWRFLTQHDLGSHPATRRYTQQLINRMRRARHQKSGTEPLRRRRVGHAIRIEVGVR